MTNHYSAPEYDEELKEILNKIPDWQERFLRLLQVGVVKDDKDYAKEMADMVLGLVVESYDTGKLKGILDASSEATE